ncbi:uncharacterized protein BO96DRAFT_46912 [Aspergillus niger CBS 101883]|uniref:uncharacterized protein n=1 Tax=Aspergillus lacticoffeatus (strain CBS 101883) TaxID=1450533 RepID=UPI000D7EF82A|nr:uncharacterized protein BO96DRAFT_46912 [Aspergillus niger CBS 101883]PYH56573.1 hypothetical protein BO96DRAFT_46912 [Aspergillus niger CBS 101883]
MPGPCLWVSTYLRAHLTLIIIPVQSGDALIINYCLFTERDTLQVSTQRATSQPIKSISGCCNV